MDLLSSCHNRPLAQEQSQAQGGVPYPASWLDRMHEQLERQPGPVWLIYTVLALVVVIAHALIKWQDGSYPAYTLQPFHVVVMVSGFAYLALIHYLNWAAKQAIEQFGPALEICPQNVAELVYCLLTLPARPTLVTTFVGLGYGALLVVAVANGYIFAPAVKVFTSPLARWFESAIGIFVCTAFALFIYHTIHQVKMVNRIYKTCPDVDLFNLTPIHALSVLTAQTAAGGLLIAYVWIATEPGVAGDRFSLTAMLVTIVLALITFLWPLLDMHRLLLRKKRAAQANVGRRIKACTAELHRQIDGQLWLDLQPTITALGALQQEEAWLTKLPTWPWQPETLRSFATAILLPIVLWLVTKWLEHRVSF
jgi:hypothetical protein